MKITKLGHCCMVIEQDGLRILTDPGNYSTGQEDQKDIDVVLITHEHSDHFHVDSVKAILKNNPEAKIITNKSVGALLEKESIDFILVGDGESYNANGVSVRGMGTRHAEIYKDFGMVENTSYFIGDRFFYPGDAFYNPNSPVEILALPVAGPWCKISEAVEYALAVNPKKCFPVHDGGLKIIGGHHKVPKAVLGEAGINFETLDLEKEYEF